MNLSSNIVASLDWCDVVFEDLTVSEVFNVVGLVDSFTPDFIELFLHYHPISRGYQEDLVFDIYGGSIQLHGREVYDRFNIHSKDFVSIDPDKFFYETRLDYIKLSLPGSALQYLRQSGFDVENWIFHPFVLPRDTAAFHFTRLDFAFDLLNYQPDFIKKCVRSLRKYSNKDTCKICVGNRGAITWEYQSGRKDVLYLGKGASDLSLRIYDKLLQLNPVSGNGKLASLYSYGSLISLDDLSSWVRIELQVRRREKTAALIYSQNSDFCSIFKYIYDQFAFRESSSTVYSSNNSLAPITKEWQSLFDWDEIPSIILSKNFVELGEPLKDPIQRVVEWMETSVVSNLIVYIGENGPGSLDRLASDALSRLQRSDSPYDIIRLNKIIQKMCCRSGKLPNFVISDNGFLKLKQPEDLIHVLDRVATYFLNSDLKLCESEYRFMMNLFSVIDYFYRNPTATQMPNFNT